MCFLLSLESNINSSNSKSMEYISLFYREYRIFQLCHLRYLYLRLFLFVFLFIFYVCFSWRLQSGIYWIIHVDFCWFGGCASLFWTTPLKFGNYMVRLNININEIRFRSCCSKSFSSNNFWSQPCLKISLSLNLSDV